MNLYKGAIILLNRVLEKIRKEAYRARLEKIIHNGSGYSIGERLFIIGSQYIDLGKDITIGNDCIITAWSDFAGGNYTPSIKFGENCNIGSFNHISSINRIELGNNLLTGRWVTITDHAHGEGSLKEGNTAPIDRSLYSKGPVIIRDNVWIGDKVTILPGVTIGNNVTIGANSVVTKDLPDNCIAAGIPAKIIKMKG